METLKIFNEENVSTEEMSTFSQRLSTRAIMIDAAGTIGLLYSKKLNYYTLPGGGIDAGETGDQAVIRECKEETGYTVEIIEPVGRVLEIRKNQHKISEVLGYTVRIVGEQGEAELMPDEIEEDFVIQWFSPQDAKELFRSEIVRIEPEHQQISKRALTFLEKAFPEENIV